MTQTPTDLGGWDVHTHLIPPALVAAIADKAVFGMTTSGGTLRVCAHGVPLHPISDADKLADRVVCDGLDGAVVSVPPPLFRPDLGAGERRAYVAMINAGLRDACVPHGTRLRPLAYLPAEDPALAAEVADRLDESWVGVVIGTELSGRSYADADYAPLWTVLERRRLAAFLHPGTCPDARLDRHYLSNLLGNPYETTLAAADLILGGVFERHPRLTIVLAHGGGCAATLAGRWQQGVLTRRPGVPERTLLPRDALRRFYVDSLVHHPAYLDYLIAVVGADRIVLGSDWPFPMGAADADHDIGHLDAALRRRIRCDNAETAFGRHRLRGGGTGRSA
jgi:aminocarboxymuconate-semialdehyde decarboxylase